MTDVAALALARWDMADATCTFVAGRENRVFRVSGSKGDFALRIRRPGLRSLAELRSELGWLDAMDRVGLSVPWPEPATSGALVETVAGYHVDLVGWLAGEPMGKSGTPPRPETFRALGREMARLHSASDAFQLSEGFVRVRWNIAGLLGEAPVWGRFWENPTLDDDTRDLFEAFRTKALRDLQGLARPLDYGLIHADLVRENVLVDDDRLRLIDFDDGGYGFRLFDVATALLKNRAEPDYESLKSSLLEGYQSIRDLDMAPLDLFMALRAVTYVGWIICRMDEACATTRNTRFVKTARTLCAQYLCQRETT